MVLLTLGAQGALLVSSVGSEAIPTPAVSAIDTSGAGDAFLGALAHFLCARPDLALAEAARRACHIAALSTTKHGTQSSYPDLASLPSSLVE
jgi:ribokinase